MLLFKGGVNSENLYLSIHVFGLFMTHKIKYYIYIFHITLTYIRYVISNICFVYVWYHNNNGTTKKTRWESMGSEKRLSNIIKMCGCVCTSDTLPIENFSLTHTEILSFTMLVCICVILLSLMQYMLLSVYTLPPTTLFLYSLLPGFLTN